MWAVINQVIMALLGSIGFGILFNLRGLRLMLAGLGGMLGWIIYLILFHFTGQEVMCYGIATILTTLYSQALARIVKSPATLFLVPSVVPMLPGGYLYYTMLYAVQGNWDAFLSQGILTLSTATAIAVGMMLGSSLYSTILAIKRAIEGERGEQS
ncbi:MAG: threonine/serine exporter family protein [Candidatus Fimadaptatus sp.]|jgi:uncharacterized membrane protein YjjB (DUF3815 family)